MTQSDRYRVAATVDVKALDADLQAAEEATLRALDGFKALVDQLELPLTLNNSKLSSSATGWKLLSC